MFRIPSHLRSALQLLAAIAAFVGALMWAFRYDAAVTAYDRQHALVTVGILLVVAWVNVALWFRSQRQPGEDVESEDHPLYRTPLGYRLDLRHRFAWRLADLASELMQVAGRMQERAATLSRGEITPVLPMHLDQLDRLAYVMDISVVDLTEQMDWARVCEGRRTGQAVQR